MSQCHQNRSNSLYYKKLGVVAFVNKRVTWLHFLVYIFVLENAQLVALVSTLIISNRKHLDIVA